jgi:hypothetical protein
MLELAGDHELARDLVAGGVFVPGYDLPMNEDCELVLRGAGGELRVAARVVWSNGAGVGLQLDGCGPELKQRIAALAEGTGVQEPPAFGDAHGGDGPDGRAPDAGVAGERPDERAEGGDASGKDEGATTNREAAGGDGGAEHEGATTDREAAGGEADGDEDAESDREAAGGDEASPKLALNVHERLRGLTLAQQLKLAHHGEVSERIVLERLYGKNVWEALLRNPRLTGPEVARIARMGSLPRPLIEIIVGNGSWLQIPEVRRALLSNPRLGPDQIMRVLRLLPKHELKLAGMQTAYPHAVRDAAKRLLREAGGG